MIIPEDIGEYLSYDPQTGALTWLVYRAAGVGAGHLAGSLHYVGKFRTVSFKGRRYLAHRIAWFLMTGEQPPALIDHIDLDPANNRWSNLRPATHSLNGANVRSRRNGRKGVTLRATGRYQAQIKRGGKSYYLGVFDTEEEAASAYAAKATELFGTFARAA